MKKTLTIEFPDNFEFPPVFEYTEKCRCKNCPMHQEDNELHEWCAITGAGIGYTDSKNDNCPFYGGADTVEL